MGVPRNQPGETQAVRGTFFHTPRYGQLEALRDALVVVRGGKIIRVAPGSQEAAVCAELGVGAVRRLQVMGPNQSCCPPFWPGPQPSDHRPRARH